MRVDRRASAPAWPAAAGRSAAATTPGGRPGVHGKSVHVAAKANHPGARRGFAFPEVPPIVPASYQRVVTSAKCLKLGYGKKLRRASSPPHGLPPWALEGRRIDLKHSIRGSRHGRGLAWESKPGFPPRPAAFCNFRRACLSEPDPISLIEDSRNAQRARALPC